jgi:hypothetical protein
MTTTARTPSSMTEVGHARLRRAPAVALALLGVFWLVAACGSSKSNSSKSATTTPSWAAALGAGVTVTPPSSNPPADTSSPGGVVKAELAAFTSGRLAAMCNYLEPAVQARCSSAVAGQTDTGALYTNFALGYIASKGTQALVGTLGTDCEPNASPTCVTNSDPAAVFSSDKTFDLLYSEAVASQSSSGHAYALIPCVKVGSNWYVYLPANGF